MTSTVDWPIGPKSEATMPEVDVGSTCATCAFYSIKVFRGDDDLDSSGKCFGAGRRPVMVDGSNGCALWRPEPPDED